MQKLYTPHQVLAASTLTANVLFAALQAALRFKIAPSEFDRLRHAETLHTSPGARCEHVNGERPVRRR
jgi:hypothetical protein